MAITINGTTGISGVDGSAGTPSLQGQDTNTGFFYGTDILGFSTGGTERMRLDSSGNLGLGVTPSAWGGNYKGLQITGGSVVSNGTASLELPQNAYYNGSNWIYAGSGFASKFESYSGLFAWKTAPSGTAGNAISFTQAMTLDASGNLLVGTTTVQTGVTTDPVGISLYGSSANGAGIFTRSSPNPVLYINNKTANSGLIQFYNGGNSVGSITSNGTGTTYGTSSDYRLKENIQPMQNALATISQLNPVTYTWKNNGYVGQGFIAHELQAVVPDCVTGEKDAVDDEGNPVYQGIDTSFLVATLTKAIQELNEKVEQQAAEIAALKGAA